jgi:hypothetical protein
VTLLRTGQTAQVLIGRSAQVINSLLLQGLARCLSSGHAQINQDVSHHPLAVGQHSQVSGHANTQQNKQLWLYFLDGITCASASSLPLDARENSWASAEKDLPYDQNPFDNTPKVRPSPPAIPIASYMKVLTADLTSETYRAKPKGVIVPNETHEQRLARAKASTTNAL